MTEEGKDILKTFTITSLEEIDKVAGDFIQYISESDLQSNIFAFYGKMGAGKTTFIKAICKVLGVKDIVNSPTFTEAAAASLSTTLISTASTASRKPST